MGAGSLRQQRGARMEGAAVMGRVPAGGVGAAGPVTKGAALGRDAGEVRRGGVPG